jgi:hypothetical protein
MQRTWFAEELSASEEEFRSMGLVRYFRVSGLLTDSNG